MRIKLNVATAMLIGITLALGGLGLFAVVKFGQEDSTRRVKIKADDRTYSRSLALAEPTSQAGADETGAQQEGLTPTVTDIPLETSPPLTPEPTGTELAQAQGLTPTPTSHPTDLQEKPSVTAQVTAQVTATLPKSGAYDIPLVMVTVALGLIFIGFVF